MSDFPSGLVYIDDFLSNDYQKELIQFIDKEEWDGSIARRTQHYGYKYDYKNRDANTKLGDIPEVFDELLNNLTDEFDGIKPTQVIINEYVPKQGIGAHIDHVKYFGPIVASVSLLSPIEMEFSKGKEKHLQILKPLSAVILKNEARYKYTHQIRPRDFDMIDGLVVKRKRRVSITFRTMKSLDNN